MNPPLPRLHLLGTPCLRLADADPPRLLPDALPGYLLAYLGARGDWVLREEVAVLLWPEAAEPEAQHNLRVNLNRVRGLLRGWGVEDALQAERRRVRLLVDTDVTALRAALATSAAETVLALDGRFLQGLSFRAFPVIAEWAQREGERLRAEWRGALIAVATSSMRSQPERALQLLDQLEPAERLDEAVMRCRLGALAAQGREADARQALAAFRRDLRDELGVVPSASFESFVQGLLPSAPAVAAVPTTLLPPDALVGRAETLASLQSLLAQARVVTLAGLGGVGKTRLARAAIQAGGAVGGGAVAGETLWLSLAELDQAAGLLARLADALGLPAQPASKLQAAVVARLAARPTLLVLDNLEHLLGSRALLVELLDALLAGAPELRVLITSREPVDHPAEHVLRLRGLALPDLRGDGVLQAPAVQLFVAQARLARPDFDAAAQAASITRIAHLTGGLPLALRVAAGWTRFLGCAQIAAEIERSLDALDASAGAGGLRATLAWSWSRLARPLTDALARLSTFAGSFDLDDARSLVPAPALLAHLAQLADASLIETLEAPEPRRFALHPLLRQLAREKLALDAAAARAARAAHRAWVERRLAAFADWRRVDQKAALRTIGALLDDARLAWRSALEGGDASFIAHCAPILSRYFEQKGAWDEGIALFAAAESGFDPDERAELAALAALARARATLLYRRTDFDAAEALAQRGLAWARTLDHRESIKANLNTLGLICSMQHRIDEARHLLTEAAEIAHAEHDAAGEAVFRANLAMLAKRVGDYAAAEAGWRQALALHREVGNWRSAVNVLANLGNLLRIVGRLDEAQALLEEGLRLCDEHGFTSTRPFLLINIAQVHAQARRLAPARSLAEQALADVRRHGEPMLEAATLLVLAELALQETRAEVAAPLLAQALQLTAANGDIANRLEAMGGYASWLAASGAAERAHATWSLLRAHPRLHGDLARVLDERIAASPLDAAQRARAEDAARDSDFTDACERARRELEAAAEAARTASGNRSAAELRFDPA